MHCIHHIMELELVFLSNHCFLILIYRTLWDKNIQLRQYCCKTIVMSTRVHYCFKLWFHHL